MAKLALVGLALISSCPAVHLHDECQSAERGNGNDHDSFSLLQSSHDPFSNSKGVNAFSENAVKQDTKRQKLIPPQLIMTGRFPSLQDLPAAAMENLNNTRTLAPGLTLRYLNDSACRRYLAEHFVSMVKFYDEESHGSFRGDICRSAVLLREGGFYADLDFALYAPLPKLIDENTTFMTVLGAEQWVHDDAFIMNALIAVRPNSLVMQSTMSKIEKWYAGPRRGLLGTAVMAQAISEIMQQNCPGVPLPRHDRVRGHVDCGAENLRFYQEVNLGEPQDCAQLGSVVCPEERQTSDFFGTRIGIFSLGDGDWEKRLIGWPRYLACSTLGCNINGGVASL